MALKLVNIEETKMKVGRWWDHGSSRFGCDCQSTVDKQAPHELPLSLCDVLYST